MALWSSRTTASLLGCDRRRGFMMGTKNDWVYGLFQGEEDLEICLRLGELTLAQPGNITFDNFEFFDESEFAIRIFLDCRETSKRVLNLRGME